MKKLLIRIIQWTRTFIRENFHSENEELPYYLTIIPAFVLFIVTLNAFVDLTEQLAEHNLATFDTSVTDYVHSFRTNGLTTVFIFFTHMGDRFGYLAVMILLVIFFLLRHRSWKFIIQIVIVLALATASNVLLKEIINRERPAIEHLVTVNTLSYPSGHAMTAMAFYGFLIYLCVRYRIVFWQRVLLIAVLVSIILSIGMSRIYLGVHYPSDVLAGYIGGLIWVTFCVVLFNLISLLQKRRRTI